MDCFAIKDVYIVVKLFTCILLRGFNPEAEQEYVMLCQDLCDGDGVHGAQIVPESDDDAMVIEDSNVAPNTTCPLSGKNVRLFNSTALLSIATPAYVNLFVLVSGYRQSEQIFTVSDMSD